MKTSIPRSELKEALVGLSKVVNARANQLAAFIDTYGVDTVLAGAAPHTSDEFSCGRWPGEETPVGDVTPEDFLGV